MQTTKALVGEPEGLWAKPLKAETLLAFGHSVKAANLSAF